MTGAVALKIRKLRFCTAEISYILLSAYFILFVCWINCMLLPLDSHIVWPFLRGSTTPPTFLRPSAHAEYRLTSSNQIRECRDGDHEARARAGCGVVRIDPLRFLAGCHKMQLNQALSVLSLNLDFFWCMCCAVNEGLFLCCAILCYLCVLSLGCSCQVVSTSASDWLERLLSEMICVDGEIKPYTHSFTHSLTHSLTEQGKRRASDRPIY